MSYPVPSSRRFALLISLNLILAMGLSAAWAQQIGKAKSKAGGEKRPGGVPAAYQIQSYTDKSDKTIRYGWLEPLQVENGKKYPLVLCLHGRGGNTTAADVLAGEAMRKKYPCYIVAPESDPPSVWAGVPGLGKGGDSPQLLPLAIGAVRVAMAKYPIDPARVYVTGQSMGGVGSWASIARYPELFAAAVPVCGAWPVEDVPRMMGVPVWAFHGEKDPTVPVKFSRELTAAITKAGGTAKYTEYPGVGHDSWTQAYADQAMWEWLFSQRKTIP